MQRWRQSWFLISLVAVLAVSIATGMMGPRALVETFIAVVRPNVTTTIVLLLMAYSLDSTRLRESLRRPAGALWGSLVNLGLMPLLAAGAAPFLKLPDFALGLVLMAISPCTLATASVFTRRAGGNDAVSLLVTLLTNVACVVIAPLWLQALVSKSAELDTAAIVRQLVICVLLPTLIGQLCLWPRFGRELADRCRPQMNFVSQLIVLLIVAVAAVTAGLELRRHPVWPTFGDASSMAIVCIVIHIAGLAAGWYGAQLWRLAPEDRIATAIAGSQKTLPVGLLMATNPSIVGEGLPFATFPLLAYHMTQLVIDTAVADAWRARRSIV